MIEDEPPLKPPALLTLVDSQIVSNHGPPIVFCMPRALLLVANRGGGVPDGVCVWLGRGSYFDVPVSKRYGHVAHEDEDAPKLQLTPRLTPSITPAKLPSLIPSLVLSPAAKKPRW